MTNTEERTVNVVRRMIAPADCIQYPVTLTDKFIDDLECDSLDVVEIIFAAEEEFAISIDDAAFAVTRVYDLVDLIDEELNK